MTKVEKDLKYVEYEYNSQNLLSKIKHGNKEYHFTYDEFLNTKDIKIGNQVLITNHYETNNGNLKTSTYGNGDKILYSYDEFDRIKQVNKENDYYTYHYDNLGNIAKITSKENTYQYYYDVRNRLIDYDYDTFHLSYDYDEVGNIKDKYINNLYHIGYEYNKDNAVTKVNIHNQDMLSYTYDELGRMKEKNLNDKLKNHYHYITKGNRTSFVLDEFTSNDDKYSYQYDQLDNITDIYYNNVLSNHYEYDNSNELIKEDDYKRNITTIYSYDNVGNILSKKEYELNTESVIKEDTYEYSNTAWEDQLTKFNNEEITYDEIGNPVTIGDKILSWANGRQLERIIDGETEISFQYNKDSIRTEKIVNEVSRKYYLENNQILFEEFGKNMIYYIRDDNNHLIGFRYNGETYYYVKNAQEDIIGILDSNYNKIATYEYDAWGKIVSIKDCENNEITDSNHIAHINPFRYRSYYYDEETKLYYLNSRYYNPNFGRFMNADNTLIQNNNFIENNLYIYCSNNPINRTDLNGNYSFKNAFNDWKDGMKIIANKISQGYKKTKKNISDVVNNVSKTITKTVKSIKENFVIEGGIGTGVGATVSAVTINNQISAYQDVTLKYSNGKITTSVTGSWGIEIGGIGISDSQEHEYPFNLEEPGWKHSLLDIGIISRCPNTIHSSSISYGKFEKSNSSVFIGIQFELHGGIGGHFKIGWEF